MNEQATPQTFESWGIVEIMGHARLAGRISEAKACRSGGRAKNGSCNGTLTTP